MAVPVSARVRLVAFVIGFLLRAGWLPPQIFLKADPWFLAAGEMPIQNKTPLPRQKRRNKGETNLKWLCRRRFFHPDYTVGFGISPNQHPADAGWSRAVQRLAAHRRWGISPRPETDFIICIILSFQEFAI